jgi:hypothetical protein
LIGTLIFGLYSFCFLRNELKTLVSGIFIQPSDVFIQPSEQNTRGRIEAPNP